MDWILALVMLAVGVFAAGYVYHRWPTLFGKAADSGATIVNDATTVVNDAIDKVKGTTKP